MRTFLGSRLSLLCRPAPRLGTIALLLFFATPAGAYIDTSNLVANHTLPYLLSHYKYVIVLRVERINLERDAVLLKAEEWIKGSAKSDTFKHNYGPAGNRKELLKQFQVGQKVVCFCNNLPDDRDKAIPYVLPRGTNSHSIERQREMALVFRDSGWTLFSVPRDDPSWLNYWAPLPDLNCCFAGTTAELLDAVKRLRKGESVVVRTQVQKGKAETRAYRYRPNRNSKIPVVPLTPKAQSLQKMELAGPAAVQRLTAGLKDPETAVRMTAADLLAMTRTPGPTAVQGLTESLGDTEACVREAAAEALGNFGSDAKTVVPALGRTLKDENRFVRDATAASLGRIGTGARSEVPALVEAILAEGEKHERDYKLSADGYAAALISMRDALGKIDPAGDIVGPVCVKHLSSPDWGRRYHAVWTVRIIGPQARRAVACLVQLYEDNRSGKKKTGYNQNSFRYQIIFAISSVGGPTALKEAVPTLQKVSRDPDEASDTRQIAGETLARWKILEKKDEVK